MIPDSTLLLSWQPLLPWEGMLALGVLTLGLLLLMLYHRVKGVWLRLVMAALFFLLLANPGLLRETREMIPSQVIAIVDQSPSMEMGGRPEVARTVEKWLDDQIARAGNLTLSTIYARPMTGEDGTRLFEELRAVLAQTPADTLAGVVLISDGEIHDVPAEPFWSAPLHLIQTTRPQERDRMVKIIENPGYGLIGQKVQVRFRVEETPARESVMPVQIFLNHTLLEQRTLVAGTTAIIDIPIEQPGTQQVDIIAPVTEDDINPYNNQAHFQINGVRERLRVLLVTGSPHNGGKMWRQILKGDPSVDLVHFTILRPPDTLDRTPVEEISLIAFPVERLFRERIRDFDLIIFDDYENRGVLSTDYYNTMAEFVQSGGGFLEIIGDHFADRHELKLSQLMPLFPMVPHDTPELGKFRPRITDTGALHPVTAPFEGEDTAWGSWFRHASGQMRSGSSLLSTADGNPLLVVDRVGQGRIALVLSDQLWLWQRGYENGGPALPLLKRLSHWLMKEPELDEYALRVAVEGQSVTLTQPLFPGTAPEITLQRQGQTVTTLKPAQTTSSARIYRWTADTPGFYVARDNRGAVSFALGGIEGREWSESGLLKDKVKPLIGRAGGRVIPAADLARTQIITGESPTSRRRGLYFQDRQHYRLTGVEQTSLLPYLLILLLGLTGFLFGWWRESR